MNRKARKYVFLLVLLFPFVPAVLSIVNESNNLLWIALDTLYYYPVYILFEPLFKKLEMGLILPSTSGRALAFTVYGFLIVLFFKVKDRMGKV